MKEIKKIIKSYWIALRVLSLTLALASTTYGIIAAYMDGHFTGKSFAYLLILIVIITLAGLAAQAGANLINDYFEGSFKYPPQGSKTILFLKRERTYFDVLVFLSGLAALGFAALIGLYLIYITDIWMLVIGFIGLIGSYAYTGEPFVYKRKGLGAPLSFLIMGPLMTLGAYYPFASSFSWTPILISLPTSLLIPSLMISNEMRDFLRDQQISLGTMSVRLGSDASKLIFTTLVASVYILTMVYVIIGLFPIYALAGFTTLPYAIKAVKNVRRSEHLGIPNTNKVHLYYSLIIFVSLIMSFQ